jgi:hypothetical protein
MFHTFIRAQGQKNRVLECKDKLRAEAKVPSTTGKSAVYLYKCVHIYMQEGENTIEKKQRAQESEGNRTDFLFQKRLGSPRPQVGDLKEEKTQPKLGLLFTFTPNTRINKMHNHCRL